MTENEWLEGYNVGEMLDYLKGNGSHRKFRLFAIACLTQIKSKLLSPALKCLTAAELFVEGKITASKLKTIKSRAGTTLQAYLYVQHDYLSVASPSAWYAACNCSRVALLDVAGGNTKKVNLLREIFGNPFNPVRLLHKPIGSDNHCSCDGADTCPLGRMGAEDRCSFKELLDAGVYTNAAKWLIWNDGCVNKLAKKIYQEKEFSNTPILADALEESGCSDESILSHLRSSGPHVRGCWVLDLLLAKD